MDPIIDSFFSPKNMAVVGVSHSRESMGNAIVKTLFKSGYKVFPIHPDGGNIGGISCLKSLEELPVGVSSLVVATSPKNASEIVELARNAGIKKIWFQQGANFRGIVEKAKESGMVVISRKCVLLYAQPVSGIHSVHRFFAQIFRRL